MFFREVAYAGQPLFFDKFIRSYARLLAVLGRDKNLC